ncbi:MAG: DNA polymerase III subunit chi [Paracoccaceae bacterium]
MGEAYFYHLTRSDAATALRALLGRAVSAGWRVEVRGRDAARMEALDLALWEGPADAVVPHGLAGGPDDRQPVLLTTSAMAAAADGRDCLMTVDGAEVAPGEVADSARTCILFDGDDEAAVAQARSQWRGLTGAGIAAVYWAQGEGGWVEKRRSGG